MPTWQAKITLQDDLKCGYDAIKENESISTSNIHLYDEGFLLWIQDQKKESTIEILLRAMIQFIC
jgi:hypothetical protein